MNVADTNKNRSRRKVLLTRSKDDCAQWATELAQRGIGSASLPCISTETIDTAQLRAQLRNALPTAQWVIVTSRRGVDALARICAIHDTDSRTSTDGATSAQSRAGTDANVRARAHAGADANANASANASASARVHANGSTDAHAGVVTNHNDEIATATEPETWNEFNFPKVAAVGNATAQHARELLGRVDLIGAGTAEDLAQRFIEQVASPASVLIVVAENAGTTLEHELAAAGFDCQRFNVYRTIPAASRNPKPELASYNVDAVLLASPSAVVGLTNQLAIDTDAVLITIGPSTSRAVRDHGLQVAAEADETSLDGLVRTLASVLPLSQYDSDPTFTETLHV